MTKSDLRTVKSKVLQQFKKSYKLERDFEIDVRKYLKKMGCKLLPKLESGIELGIADVLFTYHGQAHAWELKLKPFKVKSLTLDKQINLQANWLYNCYTHNWVVAIVSPEDFFENLVHCIVGKEYDNHFLKQYKKEFLSEEKYNQ